MVLAPMNRIAPRAGEPSMSLDRSSETTAAGLPWGEFARCRAPFVERWPSVFRLRLVRDHHQIARELVREARSVLDVGATERLHEAGVRAAWPGVDYRSFDVDRTHPHDYHDFAEIDRQFDLLTLLEVLEHVQPPVAVEIVKQCFQLTRPGGHLLVSVPNVYRPGVQQEWTHVAQFPYMDLAALLSWAGFEIVDGARVFYAGTRGWLLHAKLMAPLHRFLSVDFAHAIVMLCRRPG
jgi:SAM-dependent methyltransferase